MNPSLRFRAGLTALVAATVLLSGCGGGDTQDAAPTPTPATSTTSEDLTTPEDPTPETPQSEDTSPEGLIAAAPRVDFADLPDDCQAFGADIDVTPALNLVTKSPSYYDVTSPAWSGDRCLWQMGAAEIALETGARTDSTFSDGQLVYELGLPDTQQMTDAGDFSLAWTFQQTGRASLSYVALSPDEQRVFSCRLAQSSPAQENADIPLKPAEAVDEVQKICSTVLAKLQR